MRLKQIIFLLAFINLFTNAFGQEKQVRIAFMGNSITIGSGLISAKTDCYPAQLQEMLTNKFGDTCVVGNFAVSGRTLLKKGDYPIWKEHQMKDALRFAPNICFILLGTNDSKPQNWDNYGNKFIDDYLSLIDTFLQRNPQTEFIVSYPPPAYEIVWGIRDSVIVNGVIPAVDSIMKLREATLVDFYTPLIDSVNLFPDYIHPDKIGATVMAEIVYDRLIETDIIHTVNKDYTFVSNLEADEYSVPIKDTIIVSWKTANADSVTLQGIKVDKNGSKEIIVSNTGYYELIAYGKLSNDTSSILIEGYDIEISRLQVNSSNNNIAVGETVELELLYFDQNGRLIDTLTSVTWIVVDGEGEFESQDANKIVFTAGNTGKIIIEVQAGGISGYIAFRLDATNINENLIEAPLIVYPNPISDNVTIHFNQPTQTEGQICIYSSSGQLIFNTFFSKGSVSVPIYFDDNLLPEGTYIYRVVKPTASYSGYFIKY